MVLVCQVLYPDSAVAQTVGDAEIMRLLQDLGLGFLLARPDGLDAVEAWDAMLSPGEQQRLGFARVLYHKCVLVLPAGALETGGGLTCS